MSRIVVVLVVLFSSTAFGQIVYEPVQYQHGREMKYYYGGTDPLKHKYANRELYQRAWGNAGVFSGADRYERQMFNPREAVYTDDFLSLSDASRFGYSANDAHNEANANAPLYFRKSEILATAERQLDGSLVVPANAQTTGRVYVREETVRPAGATKGVILIIPKKMMDRPVKSDRLVASAR